MTSPRPGAVGLLLLMFAATIGGCLGTTRDFYGFEASLEYRNPAIFPGNYSGSDENGSFVLQRGFLPYGDPEVVRLRSPRPASPTGQAVSENEQAVFSTMAVWRPIEGFVNGTIPVIVHAGTHFEIGTHCPGPRNQGGGCPQPEVNNTITWPDATTSFLLRNFVPLGFAVAQVAIRGTGTSGGCFEMMGPNEAADLDQAVTFLGQQEWSNGNVAFFGSLYGAAAAWMAASAENEHVRAIVPSAGFADLYSLIFRNGTSQRNSEVYFANTWNNAGFGDNFPHSAAPVGSAHDRQAQQNRQNLLCPEAYEALASSMGSGVSGERPNPASPFWTERDYRGRILENFRGAVFLAQGISESGAPLFSQAPLRQVQNEANEGLQETGMFVAQPGTVLAVRPHTVVPFVQALGDAGIDVREWYGQFQGPRPDLSGCQKDAPRWLIQSCRIDYAEILYRFLDHHLRENSTQQMGPPVQVQDSRGYWRIADSFPPEQADWLRLHPNAKGQLVEGTAAPQAVTLLPPSRPRDGPMPTPFVPVPLPRRAPTTDAPLNYVELRTEPFANDTHLSGPVRLHLDFEHQGDGGLLTAWMFDEDEKGDVAHRLYIPPNERRPVPLPHALAPPIVGSATMDLRFYDGGDTARQLAPGQRAVARMEFEPADILIPAGHRLTVWVFQYPDSNDAGNTQRAPVKLWLGGASSFLEVPTIEVDPPDIFPVPGANFPDPQDFPRFYHPKPNWSNLVAPSQQD